MLADVIKRNVTRKFSGALRAGQIVARTRHDDAIHSRTTHFAAAPRRSDRGRELYNPDSCNLDTCGHYSTSYAAVSYYVLGKKNALPFVSVDAWNHFQVFRQFKTFRLVSTFDRQRGEAKVAKLWMFLLKFLIFSSNR